MKKLVIFLIVIAAAGGSAYWYYTYGKKVEPPQVVQVAISQNDIVEQVQATGTLEPLRRVDVGSQVSGVVEEMFADFNSLVKKGDILAKIDPTLLQVQVEIQKANIARQEGDITNQEVQLEANRKDLERTKELAKAGLVNQQQLEAAELTVKSRVAQIDSARRNLISARASLQQAELNVNYTTIRSPIDGVVVERLLDRGQTVQASTTAPRFFVLATDLTTLKLTALVDEAEIGKVQAGQTVIFNVDSYGRQDFYGTVAAVRLNATTTNNVVTYPVWIDAPNPEYKLRPSMTASLRIVISTAPNAVRIPNQALRFRPNNDIYLALGLEPPKAGQGRALNGGRNGDPQAPPVAGATRGAAGAAVTPGAPTTGSQGATTPGVQAPNRSPGERGGGDRQAGQGGQNRQGGRQGGRGFGNQGGGVTNLTPEQRERMMASMSGRGGGRGQGAGPRGGRTGQTPQAKPVDPSTADKIDELFQPIPKRIEPGAVWTWDPTNKKLTEVRVFLGITDGQFSELISGDIKVGQQVVTAVTLPQAARTNQNNNSLFGGQQNRGNPGGMMPGGGPGGGNPGGGRGGGGGGGGRGGGGN